MGEENGARERDGVNDEREEINIYWYSQDPDIGMSPYYAEHATIPNK